MRSRSDLGRLIEAVRAATLEVGSEDPSVLPAIIEEFKASLREAGKK